MRTIKTSSIFAAALLGLVVSSAQAQDIVTARVPFPFVAGGERFPAGQYEIRVADDGTTISIRGMNNNLAAFAVPPPVDGGDPVPDQPTLVFTPYRNQYRLCS